MIHITIQQRIKEQDSFKIGEKYTISDHQSNEINELPIYLIDSCHK